MTYSDWYIAYLNQLSPSEASAFMSVMCALRSPKADNEIKQHAIREITDNFEPILKVYALPVLVSIALSEENSPLRSIAASAIDEACKNELGSADAKTILREGISGALNIISNLGVRIPSNDEDAIDFPNDYLSMAEQTADVFRLSVALAGAQYAPERTRKLVDGSNLVFERIVYEAFQGKRGRYPFILATQLLIQLDLHAQAVERRLSIDETNEYKYTRFEMPDILALKALLIVSKAEKATDVLVRAFDVNSYFNMLCVNHRRLQSTYTNVWFVDGFLPGLTKAKYVQTVQCLWRNILCLTVAQIMPKETSDLLETRWLAEQVASDLVSPWATRVTDILEKRRARPFAEYPQIQDQTIALRTFLSQPVMLTLIEGLDEIPTFIAELFLNSRDVLTGSGIRQHIESGFWIPLNNDAQRTLRCYSKATLQLITYCGIVSEHIGKGYFNEKLPAKLTELVTERSTAILMGQSTGCNEQQTRLYSGAAIIACVHLAYEELSGTTSFTNKETPWLRGDSDSNGAKICSIALGVYWNYLTKQTNEKGNAVNPADIVPRAISLAYQKYPYLLESLDTLAGDWLDRYADKGVVSNAEMLLKKYDADAWFNVSLIETKPSYFSALIHKANAVLSEDRYNEEDEAEKARSLLETWRKKLYEINSPISFPRDIRKVVAELLSTVKGVEENIDGFDERDCQQLILETTLENSAQAIHYQDALAEILCSQNFRNTQKQINVDFLSLVFIQMLVLQLRDKTEHRVSMTSPWERREENVSSRIRYKILLRFIMAFGERLRLGGTNTECNQPKLVAFLDSLRIRDDALRAHCIIKPQSIMVATSDSDAATYTCESNSGFLFKLWDAKTVSWYAPDVTEKKLDSFVERNSSQKQFEPVVRSFIDLLIEQVYKPNGPRQIELTLIELRDNGYLYQCSAGYNYHLTDSDFDEAPNEKSNQNGMILYVSIVESAGIPKLQIFDVDESNIKYESLFDNNSLISLSANDQAEEGGFAVSTQKSGTATNWIVGEDGWSLANQRKRTLMIKPSEDSHLETINIDTVRKYINLRKGSVVVVESYFVNNRSNTFRAWTSENAMVELAPDSVMLDSRLFEKGKNKKWVCVVERKSPGCNKRHASPYDEIKNAVPAVAIVSCVPKNRKDLSAKVDLHFIRDAALFSYQIPFSAFECTLSEIKVGMQVRVNVKPGEGVTVVSLSERIFVRAQWRYSHRNIARLQNGQTYAGFIEDIPGIGNKHVVQDINMQKLFLSDSAPTQIGNLCGVDLSKSTVAVFFFGNDDGVKLEYNQTRYLGQAPRGIFVGARGMYAGKVEVKLIRNDDTQISKDEPAFDVRRFFSSPSQIELADTLTIRRTSDEELAQRYHSNYLHWRDNDEYIVDEKPHVEGMLVNRDGRDMLRLSRPLSRLPISITSDENALSTDPSLWTEYIPIEATANVSERGYNKNKVFARILENDAAFSASTQQTAPFTLDRFMAWHKELRYGATISSFDKLYYAGEKEDFLFFEWGLGFVLSVQKNQLVDENNSQFPLKQLFYGDSIRKFTVTYDRSNPQEIKSMMRLSPDSVWFETEHIIAYGENANTAKNDKVLRFIKVNHDKGSGKVTIQKSVVETQRIGSGFGGAWSHHDYSNGTLDAPTVEFIQRKLSDGGGGYILVRLIRVSTPVVFQGKSPLLTFTRVPFDRNSILNDDIIPLTAGDIERIPCTENKPVSNDFQISFTAIFSDGNLLGDEQDRPIKIRMLRRQFSFNEGTLRVWSEKNKSVFAHPWFVRIHKSDSRPLSGSLTQLSPRPERAVRDWLSTPDEHVVTIGERTGIGAVVKVEIKPGVICFALPYGPCKEGSIGKLFLGNTSEIAVRAISRGDKDFVPQDGRLCELFPLDHMFTGIGEKRDRDHFTVAGLPLLKPKGFELCKQFLRNTPPRIGLVKLTTDGGVIAEKCDYPNYGYVNARGTAIEVKGPCYEIIENPNYSDLTYFDAPLRDIAKHIQRGRWHYHDVHTMVLRKSGNFTINYKSGQDTVVFFSQSGGLRRNPEELLAFAFPPHEIEEYGLPSAQSVLQNRYPIAHADKESIFVELLPGKVVELRIRSLYAGEGENKCPLTNLSSQFLSAGDIVKMHSTETQPGKPATVFLDAIEYNIRSFISKDAYLPIFKNDGSDYIVLGCGKFTLTYPTDDKTFTTATNGTTICLNVDNILSSDIPDMPREDDLVMIRYDEGELHICGFPDICVADASWDMNSHAIRCRWKDASTWLPSLIKSKPSEAIELFGGMIPLRVHSVDAEQKSVILYYPQPAMPTTGSIVCCQVIAAKNDLMYLRAGPYLLQLKIDDFLKGIEGSKSSVANEVANKIPYLWLKKLDDGSWSTGIAETSARTDFSAIKLLCAVDRANGIICEDTATLSLHWLPVSKACHSQEAKASDVLEILNKTPKKRLAKIFEDQTASLLEGSTDMIRQWNKLQKSPDRLITVKIMKSIGDGKYLCEEQPYGNIYTVISEHELTIDVNVKVLPSRVTSPSATSTVLVPNYQKRERLRLSAWILDIIQNSYKNPFGLSNQPFIQFRQGFEKSMKQTFGDLKAVWENPNTACEGEAIIVSYAAKLCSSILDGADIDVSDYPHNIDECATALCEWEEKMRDGETEPNLVVALSVVLILYYKDQQQAGKMLVAVERATKDKANEEYILANWLMANTNPRSFDLRNRLSRLCLDGRTSSDDIRKAFGVYGNPDKTKKGMLTQTQMQGIMTACFGILKRVRDDRNLEPVRVSLCLLRAIDKLPYEYEKDLAEFLSSTACMKTKLFTATNGERVDANSDDKQSVSVLAVAEKIRNLFDCEFPIMLSADTIAESLPQKEVGNESSSV